MKTITVSNIEIDIHEGKVGICASGGVDSSLLLYILMSHLSVPLHIFTCTNKKKNFSNLKAITNVIKKCIDLTDNKNIFHHIHYVEEQNENNMYLFSHFSLVKILYTGITQNPPIEVTDTWNQPTTENVERNPNIKRDLYHRNDTFYTPFHRINKKVIYEMYKELNLLDSLYPLTRSCENEDLLEGHCGECWWCEERLWGFGQLT